MTAHRLLVAGVILAGGCGPAPGALKIAITYAGPRDGCLVVRVAPTNNASKVEERELDKLPHLATRTIGVIPTAGEGDALTIEIEAHERGCTGPLVWKQTQSAIAGRPAAVVEAGILVRDADDDTFADARGAFAGGQLAGTDCEDALAQVHPGAAELCNGLDDDCNDVRDDGLTQNLFFPDLDSDGWGRGDAGQTACVQPPGFAADAGDCDDFRGFVNPAGAESCNGFDDNCDGLLDEGFNVGQACDGGCSGTLQCSDAGVAFCSGSEPLSWFIDADGDGHGRLDAGAILACVQPEPGRIPSSDDCDDTNRFIHVGAREVCDGLDDDCDPTTVETCSDAGVKGFIRFPMPTGAGVQWTAIAPFARGFTWIVGNANSIALRYFEAPSGTGARDAGSDAGADGGEDAGIEDAGLYDAGVGDGGFFNYSGRCLGSFKAAWAAPSGRLYLGEANRIDRLDLDGGCVETWFNVPAPASDVQAISGLVTGDGGVTLFAVVLDGRVFRVADLGAGGAVSDRMWKADAGAVLYTVAPLTRDNALIAGHVPAQGFYFAQLTGDGGVNGHVLAANGVQFPYALASGILSPSLAYFAGYNNTMFRWDGQSYFPISGPGPSTTSHFTGLQAFGGNHVVAADTLSRVYRFHGSLLPDGGTTADLWVDLTPLTGGAAMRALKATSPDDIWVAGDSNNVLHFGD